MNEEETILDRPDEIRTPNKSPYDSIFRSIMFIAFAVFIIGMLFRLRHWKGEDILLIVSLSAIAFAGCLRYFLIPHKSLQDYVLIVVYVTLPMGYLVKGFHWPYGELIWTVGIAVLAFHLFLRGINYVRDK